MSVRTTFLIRKGTEVWIGKDLTDSSLTLFPHTMKRDLSIPYPTTDEDKGPKVIALSRDAANIREPKRMMLKMFVLSNTPGIPPASKGCNYKASLLHLLETGYDVFVTDNETYPLMIVHSDMVDEIDERWDVEDLGDGLTVHRLKQEYFMMPEDK